MQMEKENRDRCAGRGFGLIGYGYWRALVVVASPMEEDPHPSVQGIDKTLPNTSRFTVLTDFGGTAVRDNETGLVWEPSPETKTQNWTNAQFYAQAVPSADVMAGDSPQCTNLRAWLILPSYGGSASDRLSFYQCKTHTFSVATSFTGKLSFPWNIGFLMGRCTP